MKTKIALILIALFLAGCKPTKSEVDKCVEAKAVELCAKLFPNEAQPENRNIYLDSKEKCGDVYKKTLGGTLREQCLRAQAGKE
jgi:PBP1b-binding outer membrane lipoprotein LpoB